MPTDSRPKMYEGRLLANPDEEINDQGLRFDVETLLDRRRVLKLIGYSGIGAGLLAVIGCGPSRGSASGAGAASAGASASASASAAATAAGAASCDVIP